MDYLKNLLEDYKNGAVTQENVLHELKTLPYKNLEFARIDNHRALRQGFPEVIFCQGKQKEEIVTIMENLKERNGIVIGTRSDQETADFVIKKLPDVKYHQKARILSYGEFPQPKTTGYALVISAGTADLPVAEEAIITLKAAGIKVETLFDCGVSGSHRIFNEVDRIMNATVIIAVAGMEGALASFIGGLSPCPVIAVPTSVGYGANFSGLSALLCMLNSCASCVSVVNIDNGFGAGSIASMIVKQAK